ncbi:MAG TPA: FAD-dependent thymidylate synthase [Planctomycetaceae bacterium]|nr:FAD-dependent thymidylate synthase [Planctomycetaceae bacterium]
MDDGKNQLKRVGAPGLDDILGQAFPVLDDGFVRVVDYMGADESIVQAARVSYGRGTRQVHEDRGLVRYLMRHRHTTPFEMCEIKLHVRVPLDCWRQWIRHRTASVNEYSTRYSEAIDASRKTARDEWRRQSSDNRQGSGEGIDARTGEHLSERERELQNLAREVYAERLAGGVAREQARKDLPLSTYTEAYWKIDLHNLLHFLSLRLDERAQHEIRSYATVIGNEIVSRWCPIAWEAFQDYRLHAMCLTATECAIISQASSACIEDALATARDAGWLESDEAGLRHNRERRECEAKLKTLGLAVPWKEDANNVA